MQKKSAAGCSRPQARPFGLPSAGDVAPLQRYPASMSARRRQRDTNTEITAALTRMTCTKPPKDGELLGDPALRKELERLKAEYRKRQAKKTVHR
jgi:hypothetical protein